MNIQIHFEIDSHLGVLDRLCAEVLGIMIPDGKSRIVLGEFPASTFIEAVMPQAESEGSLADNAEISRVMGVQLLLAQSFLKAVVAFETILPGMRKLMMEGAVTEAELAPYIIQLQRYVEAPPEHVNFTIEFLGFTLAMLFDEMRGVRNQPFNTIGLDARDIPWSQFLDNLRDNLSLDLLRALDGPIDTAKLVRAQTPLLSHAVGLIVAPDCRGEITPMEEILRSIQRERPNRFKRF